MQVRICVAVLLCSASAVAASSSEAAFAALRGASGAVAAIESELEQRAVAGLGARFDSVLGEALKQFDARAGKTEDAAAERCEARAQLERALDARLELLYVKQLRRLRAKALAAALAYKSSKDAAAKTEVELAAQLDDEFCAAAQQARRTHAPWDYAVERSALADAAHALASGKRRVLDAQLGAAAQQANYMQLYPSYVSQIQQLQQLQYGGGGIPLNCGVSYRVRGTNINVAGQYQQGKASVQLSCLDDQTSMSEDGALIAVPSHDNLGLSLNL